MCGWALEGCDGGFGGAFEGRWRSVSRCNASPGSLAVWRPVCVQVKVAGCP